MKIDEVTLRAFVDGELSPTERNRIEAVLSNNPELKQQADAMHASRLHA
jgi:anti-sigma factor RsiW